ncbi:MAG: hypothetical protein JSR44_15675 [Spirochaetes bacterium]|nr:hypothetical protein [Spirochaetota bacterium]
MLVSVIALQCSKGTDSAAAGSSGGSGLDGTGVFAYNGTISMLTDITASGTGGAQTFTPAGGIPSTAKFMLLNVTYQVNTGTAAQQGSGLAFFDLKVDDDTASTVNEAGIHAASAAIPTAGTLDQSHYLIVPIYVTGFYDYRGKASLKFYQAATATSLTVNTKITVVFAGFIY